MPDLLISKHLNLSTDRDWEILEQVLPDGYRHVATVDRPNGDIYDLGQNNEGNFLLFRRMTDPNFINSHGRGEALSPIDLAGFGLLRGQSLGPGLEFIEEEGEYSSLCRSNFIRR